ncbi:MAG: hypothetical protein J6S21_03495, partial [Victivallales bacterium]|nr:hypothetical protein [Victivallales bacterium]
ALQTLAGAVEFPAEVPAMNMHVHSFFSYNGEGWSPSRIALEMKKLGLYGAALCDFDVLDGMDEFMAAGDLLGLRTAVSFESRVFFPEYADKEINSPGEPGVFYFMGSGFVKRPEAGSEAAAILDGMLEQSHRRNRELIARINQALPATQLDYDRDVLPGTPRGNATERHIVRAYYDLAIREKGEGAADYWASCFGGDAEALRQMDLNKMNEYLRGKLMKSGGLGYVQPTRDTFPPIERVISMIRQCRALPVAAWLDGSLPGEADPVKQLECLVAKGVEMVNIIPDRNWNFKDPEKKAARVKALNEYCAAAAALGLPVIVGTECNKPGQRLVDDFGADALVPLMDQFTLGAQVLFGHTRLLRYADLSYSDAAAVEMFPDRNERNRFFAAVGALPAPDAATLVKLAENTPAQNLDFMRNAASAGKW